MIVPKKTFEENTNCSLGFRRFAFVRALRAFKDQSTVDILVHQPDAIVTHSSLNTDPIQLLAPGNNDHRENCSPNARSIPIFDPIQVAPLENNDHRETMADENRWPNFSFRRLTIA